MSDWILLRTLYECRNLTRTAELLYLSQPTISKRLQAMERELGVTIAVRGKRGITFTPEGEYLAVKSAQFQSLMQEIHTHLSQMTKEPDRCLSIGASSSITRYFLPALLQAFQLAHPHARFDITTGLSSQISHMVEQRKLDLGLVNGEFPFSGSKYLFRTEQGYLASSTPPDMALLPSLPYITYFKDRNTQNLIEQWWRENYASPFPQGLTVRDGDICKSMIARGLGYSFFFTREYMEEYPEYIHPLFHRDGSPLVRSAWIVCMPEAEQNQDVMDFLRLAAFNTENR
ncbi:MAG: LysR family transcriptional regulator [Eubacteriales bacterium]|nr:LysR family transcriptional regulator [Eubacteriales bacterium]